MKKFILFASIIYTNKIICMNLDNNNYQQKIQAVRDVTKKSEDVTAKFNKLKQQNDDLKEKNKKLTEQVYLINNNTKELKQQLDDANRKIEELDSTNNKLKQQIQALKDKPNQQGNNTDNKQDENTDNKQDQDDKPKDDNNQDPKQNSDVGSVTINTIHKTRENNNTNNNSESAKILKIDKNSQTQIDINYSDVAEHLSIINEKPKIIVHSSDKSPDIIPPSTNKTEAKSVAS